MRIEKFSSSFRWLNITQFLGALNDNIFKLLVIFFMVEVLGFSSARIVTSVSVLFVMPFLLFSHASGVLADRFSKRSIIVGTKGLECVIMLLGVAAIYLKEPVLFYILVFLMSTQSAIFGPAKYGIVPELTKQDQLSRANSLLVGLTYLAIILGTFVPTLVLSKLMNDNYLALAAICFGISIAGLVVSMMIGPTPPAGGRKKFTFLFPVEIYKSLRETARDRDLLLAVLGSGYFLLIAGFIQQNLFLFAEQNLGYGFKQGGYLFPVAALGIGAGAHIAGRLSGRNIEFGIVPIGAIGLVVMTFLLGVAGSGLTEVLVMMALVGVFCGLFTVPLQAFIQQRSPAETRGEIIACSSFLGFLGVVVSSGLLYVMNGIFQITPAGCFIVISLLTLVLAVWAVVVLPDFLVRFLVLLVTRIFYRVSVRGGQNIPVEGGALIVANHVTWVDALVLSATTQRRIRFLMYRGIYDNSVFKPVFKLMKVIPIAGEDSPKQLIESMRTAQQCLKDGYLVCIFAEGALTINGNMHAFRPGFDRIVRNTGCPVIPAYIGGAWGSIFSNYYGKLLGGLPRQIPYPVEIVYGAPVAAGASAYAIRCAVMELSVEYWNGRQSKKRNLGRMFVRNARRNWLRNAFSDTTGRNVSFGGALVGSLVMRARLERLSSGDMTGILLPSSVGGALLNIAVTLGGRVPVNLNFTATGEAVASAVRQCSMKTVISSHAFVEKMPGMYVPEGVIYIEDLLKNIGFFEKAAAVLKALFVPARFLAAGGKTGSGDLATVIFSSGSTGEPKGVMLTHHNIISNIEAFQAVVRFTKRDRMCAILPLFHSFGFTTTLWCPALKGFSAFYHANPLDGGKIAEIVREQGLTVLLSTPSFLLSYIRRATREDFATLRLVVAGAEKLKKKVADSFEERFGVRPIEGYGATELSPVVSINLPEVKKGKVVQAGGREGSVGHPLPGIAIRVVDPQTGDALGENEPGMLLVKGPNVMKGYLGSPEKTAEVLKDGWYVTGDIVMVDRDGFIYIRDRLSRFSKIAGEMVPHMGVEDKISAELGTLNQAVFVSSAPDERKGEQLVLFYTDEAGSIENLKEAVEKADLPNLWKPRKDNFVRLEKVPQLGSGKLDLKALKGMALDHVESKPGLIQKAVNAVKEAFLQ